jgi:hypothetical protein
MPWSLVSRRRVEADMMTRQLFAMAFCIFLPILSAVAKPAWVSSMGRSVDYPDSRYLVGFGMSAADVRMDATDKTGYARNMAMANLVASLRVSISSENAVHQFSSRVGQREDLVDEYKSKVVAKSELNLDGVQFDDFSGGRSEPAYALAYLDKEKARTYYSGKFKLQMTKLGELQRQGNLQLEARNPTGARETFLMCDRLVGDIEETMLIQELLGGSGSMVAGDLEQILTARNRSRELWNAVAQTLDEAAEQAAVKVAAQKPTAGKVQINALMLDDTYQYSQFSARFRFLLEQALAAKTTLKPMDLSGADFSPGSSGKTIHGTAKGADYLLSGSYFLKPEEIHCYFRVTDIRQQQTVATVSVRVNRKAAEGLEVQPRNYLQALQDSRVFGKDEVVGGGLNLELWTNCGAENLLLEGGDEVKFYVRVNQPCYLRFIYHLNNGARVFPDKLYSNYYLDVDKVNRPVELPTTFEICPPFGAETIQFFAATDPMPEYEIESRVIEGEKYDVIKGTLAGIVKQTRGMKTKKVDAQLTERRIGLTTVVKAQK